MSGVGLGEVHRENETRPRNVDKPVQVGGAEMMRQAGLVAVVGEEGAFADEQGNALQQGNNPFHVLLTETDIGHIPDAGADILTANGGIEGAIISHALLAHPSPCPLQDREGLPVVFSEQLSLQNPQPLSLYQVVPFQLRFIDAEGGAFVDPEDEGGNFVIALFGLYGQVLVMEYARSRAHVLPLVPAGKPFGAGKNMRYDPFGMQFLHPKGCPAHFGQVPVVGGKLVACFGSDSGRSHDGDGLRGNMDITDEGVDPHEVVHMGMTDEDGIDRFENTLCQVMDLPTVEEHAPAGGTDVDAENGIIEEAGEKDWLQMAELPMGVHEDMILQ